VEVKIGTVRPFDVLNATASNVIGAARLDASERAGDLGGDVQAGGATAEHDHIESAHISPSPSNFESIPGLIPCSAGPARHWVLVPGSLIIAAEAKLAGRVGRNPPMLVLSFLEHAIGFGK